MRTIPIITRVFGSAAFIDAGALPPVFSLTGFGIRDLSATERMGKSNLLYQGVSWRIGQGTTFRVTGCFRYYGFLGFLLFFIIVPWGMRLSIEQMDLKRMQCGLYFN